MCLFVYVCISFFRDFLRVSLFLPVVLSLLLYFSHSSFLSFVMSFFLHVYIYLLFVYFS